MRSNKQSHGSCPRRPWNGPPPERGRDAPHTLTRRRHAGNVPQNVQAQLPGRCPCQLRTQTGFDLTGKQSQSSEAQWQTPNLSCKPRHMPCGEGATDLSYGCTGDMQYLSIAELGPKCQCRMLQPRVIGSSAVGSKESRTPDDRTVRSGRHPSGARSYENQILNSGRTAGKFQLPTPRRCGRNVTSCASRPAHLGCASKTQHFR